MRITPQASSWEESGKWKKPIYSPFLSKSTVQ
jgi:hypothetical protein